MKPIFKKKKLPKNTLLRAIELADERDQVGYCRFLCEMYLQNHPNHARTLIRLANNLTAFKQYDEAKAILDKVELIMPIDKFQHYLAQRGHLLEAQGDFIGAVDFFMQAHKTSPEEADYLIFAGSAAFQSGNIDRAIQLARQATRSAEGCIDEAWFNLGGYLLSAKRYQESAECYRRALEIDPDYDLAKKRLRDLELILKSTYG